MKIITALLISLLITNTALAYTFTQLDYPSASFTSAEDIDSSGNIVGYYYSIVNSDHGYLYDGSSYTSLDYPGAVRTFAFGINDSGVIVGRYYDGSTDHGFIYDASGSGYTSLDVPGSLATAAWDINNSGDIVGYYMDGAAPFKRHGYIYRGGSFTATLDYPGANETFAYHISDSGVVVGTYVDGSFVAHGFVYDSGSYSSIDYPGAQITNADGIDSSGNIVGRYKDGSNNWHGFIYDGSSYTSLDVSIAGTTYTQAIGINDSGVIVGRFDGSGITHGYTAEPETPIASTANHRYASTDGDPVNTFSGELFDEYAPDLNLGGPMPLYFQRYYASYLRRNFVVGDLGSNWRHNFDAHLNWNGTEITYTSHKGRVTKFRKNGSAWDQLDNKDTVYQLSAVAAQDVVLYDPDDERIYTFDYTTDAVIAGKLVRIEDGKGNVHTLTYNNPTNDQLKSVSDGLGRTLTFTYNADAIPKIAIVSDGSRSVNFAYTDAIDTEYLTQVTDARGGLTTYDYADTSAVADHALMLSMTRPRNNIPYIQTFYDTTSPSSGKVKTQTDSNGNTFNFAYSGQDTTLTDPLSNTRVHTHTATGEFSNRQDEAGESFSMGSDAAGRRNSITDRLGATTQYDHDNASGKIASITNADTSTTSFTYTPRPVGSVTLQDLTDVTYADSTSESFAYDTSGNMTTHTDQLGNTVTATYNAQGQPLTISNVAGGVTTKTYNADATLATMQDPAGNVTTFGYDAFKRLDSIVFADTNTQSFTYDAEDRPLTTTDENGNVTTLAYDANGNLATITDPLLNTTTQSYDGNDRLLTTMDPLSNTTSYSYDELGRIKTYTDANGNVTALGYDARGRRTSVTDAMGEVWPTSYDAEGIVTGRADPLGNATSFGSDSMGRITQTTTPLGNVSSVSYDAMGRIATTTDPLGNVTTNTYDLRGLLSSVALPGGTISVSYTRDALGNITAITDPRSNSWQKSYDNQGRLVSSTDPLGNEETVAYDNRNRPATITYPGSLGTQTLSYDPAGNITGRAYSDGTNLTYSYDANDRLTGADGLSLSYDANGRISDSNGIAVTRDAGGRIATMTLASGKNVTYAYNANDRVTLITDWLGGVTGFNYDAAGRLTGITRSNGVSSTFSYDNDSRLTGISEGSISSISLTRDAKGQVTAATRNVPQAASAKTLTATSISFDAAAQISGAAYDAIGRLTGDGARTLTWNLASRLTGFSDGGDSISATYDAMGRRLSRTEAGVTLDYVWNYALNLTSISIERQGAADSRYYIHTPDGSLLYSIEVVSGNRRFYHYDEMGNTLFITDDSGTVIGSYAYTPYGRLLGESGGLDNPFTWQGRFGVMAEGNDIYYMRARYYDANSGRFVSRDPAGGLGPMEINPYQYALNNPLSIVDPTGLRGSFLREAQRAQEQRWKKERAETRAWLKQSTRAGASSQKRDIGTPTVKGIAEAFLDASTHEGFEENRQLLKAAVKSGDEREIRRLVGNTGAYGFWLGKKDPLDYHDMWLWVDEDRISLYDIFGPESPDVGNERRTQAFKKMISESNKLEGTCKIPQSKKEANKLHAPWADLPAFESDSDQIFNFWRKLLFPEYDDSIVPELDSITIIC